MIIYNITTQVSHNINDEWKQWMKNEFIPAMMDTGLFSKYQWVKLIEVDDQDGPTYAVQYYFFDEFGVTVYRNKFENDLLKAGINRWGDYAYSFASLMEVIN